MKTPLLQLENLSIGYGGRKKQPLPVQQNLNLSLSEGEFVCLLGPNGIGKSTLMRSIAGIQPALAGKIQINQKDIQTFSSQERACTLSLVLTEGLHAGNLSVEELVSLGRAPYTDWWGGLTSQDKARVQWALQATGTLSFRKRSIRQLSDGERQKVMIARALAQDTALILLDEPTAHLDLPNRVVIFQLLKNLAGEARKAILLTTHELDLALKVADKIWLMTTPGQEERGVVSGVPEDLVLNGTFEKVFAKEGFHFDKTTGSFQIQHTHTRKINLKGQGAEYFWTKRALERQGFEVTQKEKDIPVIQIHAEKKHLRWLVDAQTHFDTLEALLVFLQRKF